MAELTLEEALATAEVSEELTQVCTINPDTRVINIPKDYEMLGVESDEKVKRIKFSCPKIVGDDIDLTTLNLYINYRNANGSLNSYLIEDVQTVNDNIIFSWLLSRHVTEFKGTVNYIVCAKKSNGANTVNEWNTKIASGTVDAGLEATTEIEEQNADVIEQILAKLSSTSSVDYKYNPESQNAQSGVAVKEAIDKAIAYYGQWWADEKYFDITENGVISLKAAYRGKGVTSYTSSVSDNGAGTAGSKNVELPEVLALPKYVSSIAVTGFADGMFYGNEQIKELILPDNITNIPDAFSPLNYLRRIYNTDKIIAVGTNAFAATPLEKISLPSVTTIGTGAFSTIFSNEFEISLGDELTEIPQRCFNSSNVTCIQGGKNIKTIGTAAFGNTYCLAKADGLQNSLMTGGNNITINDAAFLMTRFNCDWETLSESGCVINGSPTPFQYNSAVYDKWLNYQNQHTFANTVQPLKSTFNQQNAVWKSVKIGGTIGSSSNKKYGNGCVFLCFMNAYCALRNITAATPLEVEQAMLDDAIARGKETEFRTAISGYNANQASIVNIATALELSYEIMKASDTGNITVDELMNTYYTKLAEPNTYIIQSVLSGIAWSTSANHDVLVYGYNPVGEVLFIDPANSAGTLGAINARFGTILPQNLFYSGWSFAVVKEGATQ